MEHGARKVMTPYLKAQWAQLKSQLSKATNASSNKREIKQQQTMLELLSKLQTPITSR